jgi:hypothetical protein
LHSIDDGGNNSGQTSFLGSRAVDLSRTTNNDYNDYNYFAYNDNHCTTRPIAKKRYWEKMPKSRRQTKSRQQNSHMQESFEIA